MLPAPNLSSVPPSEVLSLLHTIVERQPVAVLQSAGSYISNSMAALTPEQLQPLIKRALVRYHSYVPVTFGSNSARGRGHFVGVLLALPAAQQLPAAAVAALMTVAVTARDSHYACQLLQLPGAMHISPAELGSIVEEAVVAQDGTS
jgi:hypothetical protein